MAGRSSRGAEIRREGVKCGGVVDIGGPDEEVGQIDSTDLDSVAKEYVADIPDGGTVDCEANRLPTDATQQAIVADKTAGTVSAYTIVFTDGEQYAFNAIVTKIGRSQGVGKLRKFTFSLKISGAVTPTYS